jgi:hypothetical protein
MIYKILTVVLIGVLINIASAEIHPFPSKSENIERFSSNVLSIN